MKALCIADLSGRGMNCPPPVKGRFYDVIAKTFRVYGMNIQFGYVLDGIDEAYNGGVAVWSEENFIEIDENWN